MRIPKAIREAVEERNRLNEEIRVWFQQQDADLEGMITDEAYICEYEEVSGEPQGDGEMCDQVQYGEDSFSGTYYWECDNGQYLAMNFWI
ncbi:hypothetical protein [Peptostreptococcus anaerobius]